MICTVYSFDHVYHEINEVYCRPSILAIDATKKVQKPYAIGGFVAFLDHKWDEIDFTSEISLDILGLQLLN